MVGLETVHFLFYILYNETHYWQSLPLCMTNPNFVGFCIPWLKDCNLLIGCNEECRLRHIYICCFSFFQTWIMLFESSSMVGLIIPSFSCQHLKMHGPIIVDLKAEESV